MFTDLQNLSLKRTAKQALGFYIAYFAGGVVLGAGASWILGLALGRSKDFFFGVRVGQVTVLLYVVVLSLLMVQKKKLQGDTLNTVITFSSIFFAFVGGGLLGLIPLAYISTLAVRDKINKENSAEEKPTKEKSDEREAVEGEVIN